MEHALSKKTQEIYQRAIQDICRAFKATSFDILKEHARVIAWIEGLPKAVNSKKIYYISLVSTLNRMNDASFMTALKAYRDKQNEYNRLVSEQYERQEMSERQEENFLEWPRVLEVREKARVDAHDLVSFQDYLILCLYTHIPVVRLDFGDMVVVDGGPEPEKGNFLLVKGGDYSIVLREYKTAKKYNEQRIPAPKELARVLDEWIALNQTGWLLCNSNGTPMNEKVLGVRITTIFKKYTGKTVGVNLLRHSFVSHLRRNEKPVKEMTAVAKGMLHSVNMNALYRFIT